MGKASGGQKEEKMKMRKNEHSPKKRKKKDGLKGEENGSKKTRKATVSQAALLTLTVWKRLCECYHEILQH